MQLGAIRYDRDIRGIANYLSTQTSFGGVREKFTRLQQIGTVLNMDQVSIDWNTRCIKIVIADATCRKRTPRNSTQTPVSHGELVKPNTMLYLINEYKMYNTFRCIHLSPSNFRYLIHKQINHPLQSQPQL